MDNRYPKNTNVPNQNAPNRGGVQGVVPPQNRAGVPPRGTAQNPMPYGRMVNPNMQPRPQGMQNPVGTGPRLQHNMPKKAAKPKKSHLGIILSVVIGLLLGLIILIMMLMSTSSSLVNFEMGPFAPISQKIVRTGSTFDPEGVGDLYSDDGRQLLVKFTGWYVDPECTMPYVPGKITRDMTLYAGHESQDIISTFYMQDEKSDRPEDGIYLCEIKTKYYDEKIDLGNEDLEYNIMNLNGELYRGIMDVIKFNTLTKESGGRVGGLTKQNQIDYLDKFCLISQFSDGEDVYGKDEIIKTPAKDTAFKVLFDYKDVVIQIHSNLQVLSTYEMSAGSITSPYEDEVWEGSVQFGSEFTFGKYLDYKFNQTKPMNHDLMGWTQEENPLAYNPTTREHSLPESSNFFPISQTVKIDNSIANYNTVIKFYAYWSIQPVSVKIYRYDSTKPTYGDMGVTMQELSILGGEPQTPKDWMSSIIQGNNKNEVLVGFFAIVPGVDRKYLNFDTQIDGSRNSEYYNEEKNAIILYAVYKRVVSSVVIALNDANEGASLEEEKISQIKQGLNFKLNLGGDGQYKYRLYTDVDNFEEITDETVVENNIEIKENGDGSHSFVIRNVLEDSSFTMPTFERENYTLQGYSNARGLGLGYRVGDTYTVKRELDTKYDDAVTGESYYEEEVKATWKGNDQDFTIEDSHIGDDDVNLISVTVEYGSELKISFDSELLDTNTNAGSVVFSVTGAAKTNMIKFQHNGYDFTHWEGKNKSGDFSEIDSSKIDSSGKNINIIVDKNCIGLKACWANKTYSICFNFADKCGTVTYI